MPATPAGEPGRLVPPANVDYGIEGRPERTSVKFFSLSLNNFTLDA
jgi:hypothetical protein